MKKGKTKEDLIVVYNGEPKIMISETLLDKQDAWDRLEIIKALHMLRLGISQLMKETDDVSELKKLDKKYTEVEFELQEAWKFPKDARYHRYWNRPKCTCPKMDNEDRYGTGYSVINSECPLHGGVK